MARSGGWVPLGVKQILSLVDTNQMHFLNVKNVIHLICTPGRVCIYIYIYILLIRIIKQT